MSRSAIPVSVLYIGKLIIDQVIHLSRSSVPLSQHRLWELVALEFALAIVSDALGRTATTYLDSLLGDLFANRTTVLIMEHAATLDLDQYMRTPLFGDQMERARQQTTGRTALLSQVLGQVQDLITIAFLAAGTRGLQSLAHRSADRRGRACLFGESYS